MTRAWALMTILGLALLACSEDPPASDPISCTATRDCPGGQFCACGGFCQTPEPCATDADCCANQVCTDGLCLDRQDCGADTECGGGRVCDQCACLPRACGSAGDCAPDETCDGGVCLTTEAIPCRGLCGIGNVCDPLRDACVPTPQTCQDLVCLPGQTPIIAGRAERLAPACTDDRTCICSEPRQVPAGDAGTEASVVALPGPRFYAVIYDHFYGDLVFQELAGADPAGPAVYVDGVPDDAPLGDPAGRRGGVLSAGPNRGAMPDAALAGNQLGVAYRDRDGQILRFALRGGDGNWGLSIVDNRADSGNDPDLLALADGRWAIAHFARSGAQSFLRLAVSTGPNPSGPGDWTTVDLASGPAEAREDEDIPLGVGLMPSLIEAGGRLYVAHYATDLRQLQIARGTAGGAFELFGIDLGDTRSQIDGSTNAGLYPRLAVSPSGQLSLAALDAVSGQLLYTELVDDPITGAVVPGPIEVVDPGRRANPPVRLGGDIALVMSAVARPFLLYQDPADGSLLLAYREGAAWQRVPVVRSGVAGFSPHLFLDVDAQPWVVHGVLSEREGGGALEERLDARRIPAF